jgi:hypothetical protein
MHLIDMTLEQAVEALTKRAADLRARPRTFQEKRAAGASDMLTSIGQSPYLHALLGAGVGAGATGLHTMYSNASKEEKDKKNVMQAMLTGGLAGGALGGGASFAHKMLSNTGGQGLETGSALQPGQFKGPGGKLMQIDPETLRQNPDLAEKVKSLTDPGNPAARGVQYGVGSAWNLLRRAGTIPTLGASRLIPGYDNGDTPLDQFAPISMHVAPSLAGADLALHAPGLNLGERVGLGRVSPEMSTRPEYMIQGMGTKGEELNVNQTIRNNITRNRGDAAARVQQNLNMPPGDSWLSRLRNRILGNYGSGDDTVYSTRHTPDVKVTEDTGGTGGIPRRRSEFSEPARRSSTHELSRETAKRINRAGYETVEGENAPWLFRHRGKDYRGGKYGMMGRMGMYAAMPFAEYAIRGALEDRANENSLRDLMARYAKEVK